MTINDLSNINTALSGVIVTHTASGSETYETILNSMYSAVSSLSNKDFARTKLLIGGVVFSPSSIGGSDRKYTTDYFNSGTEFATNNVIIKSSGSIYRDIVVNTTPTVANHDYSSNQPSNGTVIQIVFA